MIAIKNDCIRSENCHMQQLQPIPQCLDCLTSLAKTATLLSVPENSPLVEKAARITRKILADGESRQMTSPQIANRILREIKRITGVDDPYAQFKANEMLLAQKMYAGIAEHVGDDLRSRAMVALLGNSLDFFKNPEDALDSIPRQLSQGIPLVRDDLDRLEGFLKNKPTKVLYLTDNAGEIYFDVPLYEYLKERCGQTLLVVKGGPSINDLTRVELRLAGLENKFGPIADTGTDGAGIDWDHVSGAFIELVDSADLILSKGMANFETLYPKLLKPPSFYLFKVKCEPIRDWIHAPADSFLALWKDGDGRDRMVPSR
jgi:damage-control phosphatase, subfamily I